MTPEKNNSVKNEVNKINSKIAKSVFRISLAGSILLGSSACVPIDSIIVTPAPEVSPLPSDLTKTPALSPTEAPVELTPIVENTATQELTLVSPTEVATEIPIFTLTSEPTAIVLPTEVTTEMMISALDLESATAVEDFRKLNEMFKVNKDIDNLVLAPEQVFSDFYNKVIPNESDLRVDIKDNKHYKIGEPFIFDSGDVRVQATLMGGFTTDNGAYVLLGTENSSTGDRSIVPHQLTFGSEGGWSTTGIKKDTTQTRIMEYDISGLKFVSAKELLTIVKENLGKNILTYLYFDYQRDEPMPEDSRIAVQKYFLFERFESNKLFINDPLSIDKNNLIQTPWSAYIIY